MTESSQLNYCYVKTVYQIIEYLTLGLLPGHGAGRLADFPRLPRPLMIISFVFPLFNFKLF